MRQMNAKGYLDLEREEGKRLFVYDDADGSKPYVPGQPVRGTLTAGIGHTGPDVRPGMLVTEDQVKRWFDNDTDWAEDLVERLCVGPKGEKPNDNQFNAMVSLAFNIGRGQFTNSSVVRMWKAGDFKAAGNAIGLWTKTTIDGVLQDSPGLIARRARETAMFFTPMPGEAPKAAMPQSVENPGKVTNSSTLKAAATVAVPTVAVVVQNLQPALDAIQSAAATAQQATTAWASVKDVLRPLGNGHVMTALLLTVALVAIGYIALRVFRRIRRGEVSA